MPLTRHPARTLSHDSPSARSAPAGRRAASRDTADRGRTNADAAPTPEPGPRAPGPVPIRPRRQPRLIAAGALLSCLGALGAAFLYSEATSTAEVAVVIAPVARGETIELGDLGTRRVGSLAGVPAVPADQVSALLGRQALVDLSPGLLPPNAIGIMALPPSRAQLGLKLAEGRLPAGDLPPGTSVLIVPVAAASDDPTEAAAAAGSVRAIVMSAPRPSLDQTGSVLDVHVARTDAEAVAALAAAERIVVVRGS